MTDKPIKTFELSETGAVSMKQLCQEILINDCDWHNGRGTIIIDGKNYFVTYSINIYSPALTEHLNEKFHDLVNEGGERGDIRPWWRRMFS